MKEVGLTPKANAAMEASLGGALMHIRLHVINSATGKFLQNSTVLRVPQAKLDEVSSL
jgi:hypothetical protein